MTTRANTVAVAVCPLGVGEEALVDRSSDHRLEHGGDDAGHAQTDDDDG
jgi:hypothetical protein